MYHCQKRIGRYFLFYLFTVLLGCKDDEVQTRQYPVIDTKPVTEINTQGAQFNAEVLNTGEFGIEDHGFVFGPYSYPALGGSNKISMGRKESTGFYSAVGNRNMEKGQTYYVRAYAISNDNNTVVYGQNISFVSLGSAPPEITDFKPKSGSIGDTIIILGSGFSNLTTNNRVSIAGQATFVIKASEDSLVITVPKDVPSGEQELKLLLGQHEVIPEEKFLLFPITLKAFTPSIFSFGDTITISGGHFPVLAKSIVKLNIIEEQARIIEFTEKTIRAIPSDNIKKSQGKVTLVAGAQTVSSDENISLAKPVITSIDPLKGNKDTEVTILGNHFTTIAANIDVKLNNINIPVVSATRESIAVKIPSVITPGSYPFSVTIAGQVVLSPDFEIIKPSIFNVSPLHGTWGNTVTITGENFSPAPSGNVVSFNGVQALVTNASSTELKVVIPETLLQKSSTITVRVIPADNQTASFATPFSLDAPVITDFTPKEGKSNTLVTITGQNFNSIKANHVVMFGPYAVEIISSTPSALVVKIPAAIEDTNVTIGITIAEQSYTSAQTFHLISPWKRIADFPSNARAGATSFTIGNYGYVGSGTKSGNLAPSDFFRYDAATDTWTGIPNYSYFGSGGSGSYIGLTCFVISDEAYVGMGTIGSDWYQNGFSKYSPAGNSWINTTDCGENDGLFGAMGYALDGKGYVTSGRNYQGRGDTKVLEFDPATNQWTRKADFPGPPRQGASGFVLAGKAYLTTGYNNSNSTIKDLWRYDATSNQWTQLTALPGTGRWEATGFALGGKGYIIGGSSTNDPYASRMKDVWRYDPTTNQWTRLGDFPGYARYSATSFVVGNKAYIGTGIGGPSNTPFLKDFWEYDPSKE